MERGSETDKLLIHIRGHFSGFFAALAYADAVDRFSTAAERVYTVNRL